jgi:hypothetical protein
MVKLTDIDLILNEGDKSTYCECVGATDAEGNTTCTNSNFTTVGGFEDVYPPPPPEDKLSIPKYVRWISICTLILLFIVFRKFIFSKSKLREHMATILIALNTLHIDTVKEFVLDLFNPVELFK